MVQSSGPERAEGKTSTVERAGGTAFFIGNLIMGSHLRTNYPSRDIGGEIVHEAAKRSAFKDQDIVIAKLDVVPQDSGKICMDPVCLKSDRASTEINPLSRPLDR
jgi:hypothetical protein